MSQTQTEQAPARTRTFDENGQTIEDTELAPAQPEAGTAETPEPAVAEEGSEAPAPGAAKYTIGDRSFDTQAEALEFARTHVAHVEAEQQIAEAYRQGLQDAISRGSPQEGVTLPPKPPEINAEELYTNPQEFLAKYARDIEQRTLTKVEQREAVNAESTRIWNEFTHRHPELADYRGEVESFVGQNQTEVRAIISTRGQTAGYDWIATKLKTRFAAYAEAVKPRRVLSNTGGGPSPTPRTPTVTPKEGPKKPSTFIDEIRSIRKQRR